MGSRSGARSRTIKSSDRISELPDSVIQHILSFLPTTRDAVRTGVLSKRWRRQWTHLPLLIFKPSGDEYFSFIENTLALHDSPIIKKFHLHYYSLSKLDPKFTSKIRFAVTKSVEELILICFCRNGSYMLPKFLIESASLVRLEMINCYFKSEWAVNWPSLKSLKMDCSCFREKDSKGIENIVSGCPLLEWLELSGYMDDDFAIVSDSLKVLSFVEADTPDAIKITCPSLVEFYMNDSMFPDQMIESVLSSSPCIHSLKLVNCRGSECEDALVIASNSLKVLHLECVKYTEITISCPNLVKLDMLCDGDILREVVNLPSTVCATLDYAHNSDYEPMDYKLLEQFQHVSTLTIQRFIVEFISDLDVEDRSSLPLLKSKCLTLNIGASFGLALPGIIHALRSPMLETLIIKLDSKYKSHDYQDLISARLDYWDSNKSTSVTCLVSHLKTVEIIGLYETDNKCKFELEFIEFLLKNAQVLKKMTVSLQKSREVFVIEFAQKLVRFPRYSRCANVELLCST